MSCKEVRHKTHNIFKSLFTFSPKLSSWRERRISRVRKFMRSHSCSATTWYGVLSSAFPISATMLNSSGSFSMISSSTARTWWGVTGCTFVMKRRIDSLLILLHLLLILQRHSTHGTKRERTATKAWLTWDRSYLYEMKSVALKLTSWETRTVS